MADKYLNLTDLTAIKQWIEGKFGLKTALETLEDRVDDIVAEGGEPNVIETVKVNGTALTPDAQKAVDVEAATHFVQVGDNGAGRVGVNYSDDLTRPSFGFYISRLTSGDPNSPLMMGFNGSTGQQSADPKTVAMIVPSKDYVDQNGGKIDTISVNGTQQTITNKNVDIPVPTATSDLTNDGDGASNFATEAYVQQNGGKIDTISVNGTQQTITNKNVDITVPTKTSDIANDSDFQDSTDVETAINAKLASVYKPKGSIAFAQLPALSASNEGFVYDINESFETTADFVEGAGKTYPAGTNVVIVDNGTDANPVYKYDVLTGVTDLSAYWTNESGKSNSLIAATVAEVNAILEPSA